MSRSLANLTLLIAAAIWGGAFVVQKVGLGDMGPITFTGARFLIGALVVAPFAYVEARRAVFTRADVIGIVVTGGALILGAVTQQIGIGYTSAANAGFLTTIYVLLVPLIELVALRRAPHFVIWPAAIGSLFGSFLLSGGDLTPAWGDVVVLISALFWAIQVFLVGLLSARTGAPVTVAFGQFILCGLVCLPLGAAVEPFSFSAITESWAALAYTGVLSVGGAFTMQAIGQRYSTGAAAAVILSAEAPFAAMFGALILGETMDAARAAGCALILACILAVQIVPAWRSTRAAAC